MAAPHVSGVAALLVSRFGTRVGGDVELPPWRVGRILERTAVDIGAPGYDRCFGHGRVDALRVVKRSTRLLYEEVPRCRE